MRVGLTVLAWASIAAVASSCGGKRTAVHDYRARPARELSVEVAQCGLGGESELEVLVRDENGDGVPNAHVEAIEASAESGVTPHRASAVSGREGRATLVLHGDSYYGLVIGLRGFLPEVWTVFARGGCHGQTSIPLRVMGI